MKKIVQSIFVIMVCSVIFLSSGAVVNAAGEPTVVYDGKQQEFTLINVTDTDLFPLYKGLIPGDIVEQNIVLKMKNLKSTTSVYLRAECDDEVKTALEGTTLDVYYKDKMIVDNQIIFENILLGKYDKNMAADLKAIIHIPTSYGNEISGEEHNIQWIFTVQEEPAGSTGPKTGDESNLIMYIITMAIAIGILIGVMRRKKERV